MNVRPVLFQRSTGRKPRRAPFLDSTCLGRTQHTKSLDLDTKINTISLVLPLKPVLGVRPTLDARLLATRPRFEHECLEQGQQGPAACTASLLVKHRAGHAALIVTAAGCSARLRMKHKEAASLTQEGPNNEVTRGKILKPKPPGWSRAESQPCTALGVHSGSSW